MRRVMCGCLLVATAALAACDGSAEESGAGGASTPDAVAGEGGSGGSGGTGGGAGQPGPTGGTAGAEAGGAGGADGGGGGAGGTSGGAGGEGGAGGQGGEPALVWSECDTEDWPDGYPLPLSGTECTFIDVPLDYDDLDGRIKTLRVARYVSPAHPTGKAMFHLAGGPGGTSVGQAGIMPRILPRTSETFDHIYVDQRGTGGSGYLGCSQGYPETEEQWIACAGEHDELDFNLFLTLSAARDLDFVREALGYERISMRGGSYGTRLALEYLRRFEDRAAAVILDGMLPPDTDMFTTLVTALDMGLQNLARDCDASEACRAVSPTLEADLLARREALRAEPRPILVDGQAYEEDDVLFVQLLNGFVYYNPWRGQIPRAIHEALSGNNGIWNRMISDLTGYSIADAGDPRPLKSRRPLRLRHAAPPPWLLRGVDYVAPALFVTVICAENFPNAPSIEAMQALAGEQTWADSSAIDLAHVCQAWPVEPISAELRSAVHSDARILVTTGAADLNTPPADAERGALTLPNATHLVFPFATHSIALEPCGEEIMDAFIVAGGDMAQVDIGCIAEMDEPSW